MAIRAPSRHGLLAGVAMRRPIARRSPARGEPTAWNGRPSRRPASPGPPKRVMLPGPDSKTAILLPARSRQMETSASPESVTTTTRRRYRLPSRCGVMPIEPGWYDTRPASLTRPRPQPAYCVAVCLHELRQRPAQLGDAGEPGERVHQVEAVDLLAHLAELLPVVAERDLRPPQRRGGRGRARGARRPQRRRHPRQPGEHRSKVETGHEWLDTCSGRPRGPRARRSAEGQARSLGRDRGDRKS